jgi:hypothetical protein
MVFLSIPPIGQSQMIYRQISIDFTFSGATQVDLLPELNTAKISLEQARTGGILLAK